VNARDRFGYTALIYAASGGHLKVVEELLDAGADTGPINQHDKSGYDLAKAKGHEGVATLLRLTQFFLAARDWDVATINGLLDEGLNPNAQIHHGWTALMNVAGHDRPQAVAALLRRGAYVDARNAAGLTAMAIAELKGFREVEQVLKFGAPDDPLSPFISRGREPLGSASEGQPSGRDHQK
jgi:uncharacterized protein